MITTGRVVLGISLAVVAVLAALLLLVRGGDVAGASSEPVDTEQPTAEVLRQDLSRFEEFDGNLGYGDEFALTDVVQGTVTWVPENGAVLKPGDALYKVDEVPTFWTTGNVPSYRELERGDEGVDVAQLQEFMKSKGHLEDDYEIDGEFDGVLRNAVREWQRDNGLDDTGRIDPGQLMFLPYDSIRVADALRVGDSASGGVLLITGPDLFVGMKVPASKRDVFEADAAIRIVLADGSVHPASVESVEPSQSQDAFGEQEYEVRLLLDSEKHQEPGEVQVEVVELLVDDVLTVPVTALVALVEGGFAVEVALANGGTEYVGVEIGEFADGWVEISGQLDETDRVVVPQ